MIISDSRVPDMLTDSDVLVPESLNGFSSGNNFNRCKRLHPILTLAFEIPHFLSFTEAHGDKGRLETFFKSVNSCEIAAESVGALDVFVARKMHISSTPMRPDLEHVSTQLSFG